MNKILACGAVVALALAAGCSNKKPAAGNDKLTEVAPPPPTHPIVTPVISDSTPIVVTESSAPAQSGRKYVVQKGDTLMSIARKNYGDASKYRMIAAANPQIKGDRIFVGQTITLP